jgi:hypothetical protein
MTGFGAKRFLVSCTVNRKRIRIWPIYQAMAGVVSRWRCDRRLRCKKR